MNGTIQLGESVAAFAAAVREQLSDLTTEQIEDLTDGLEADLAEGAVDRAGAFEPGDAREYADELRASAGLPPRSSSRPRFTSVTAAVTHWRTNLARRIRASSFGAGVLDFFIALRPLWWVLRGWLVFTLFAKFVSHYYGFFPDNIAGQLILCAVVVVSIQWGRGRWLPNRLRWAPRASNIVAGIAVVMLTMMATAGSFSAASPVIVSSPYGFGLWYDGNEVQNIFAYDAAGQPLQFVQLYTEQGAPLTTLGARADDTWAHYRSDGSRLVPPVSDAGSTAWNVFPLYALAPQFGMNEGKATPPPLPFEQARPLVGADSLLQTCEVAAEADRPVDEQ